MQPLTPRQYGVLAFVNAFLSVHGYAPSIAEIGKALNVTSSATVHKHLEALRLKGYVTRRAGHSRATIPVVDGPVCPTCRRQFAGEENSETVKNC